MSLSEITTEIIKTRNTVGQIKTDDIHNMRLIIACYDHLTELADELTQIINEAALKDEPKGEDVND